MVEVELVGDEPPPNGAGPDPATEWLRRGLARSTSDGRVLWQDDLSDVALPSGEGAIGGVGTLPLLGRVVAYRLDRSVVVLG